MAEIIRGYINEIRLARIYVGNVLWRTFGLAVPFVPALPMTGTLRELKSAIGTAVKDDLYLRNTTYANILKASFDRYTPENAGKFARIQGTKGQYNFSDLTALLDFCKANNKTMHLHAFVWPSKMPSWINNQEGTATEAQILAQIGEHIDTVLDYCMQPKYGGVLDGVDVCNEMFEDNGTYKNYAITRMAPSIVPFAVKRVNDRYPNLRTFVNDYGQEYGSSGKINALIALKGVCDAYGARLDGIGLQMHTVLRLDTTLLKARLSMLVDAGLMVHISELDMTLNRGTDNTSQGPYPFLTPELDASAASKYTEILNCYLGIPEDFQYGFTTWSVGDADNYINSSDNGGVQDYPGLRYDDYTQKPALLKMISNVYKLKNTLVYDNFRNTPRATLAGTKTGGRTPKTWTESGSSTGYGGLEVTAKGLKPKSTTNGAYSFGILDVGSPSFAFVFGLSDLLGGSSANADKNIMAVFRYLDTVNFWYIRPINSSTLSYWTVHKKANTNDTPMFADTVPANVNDVCAVITLGNYVSAYINGRFIGSVMDTGFNTQTKVGFRFRGSLDSVSAVDFVAVETQDLIINLL